LDDVQGMFVLLGGGILLAAIILLIEFVKHKREKRKIAEIKIEKHLKKRERPKSLAISENNTIEPFRPLTAF